MKHFFLAIVLTVASATAFAYNVGETVQDIAIPHLSTTGAITTKNLLSGESSTQFKVIEFFLTTCPLCNANRPIFSRLNQEFQGKVLFKLVGIDRPNRRTGRPDAILNYVSAHSRELQFEIGLDHDRAAYNLYDITETPTLYVLNANNEVVYKHGHQVINARAEAEIRSIIQGK